jgi:hypothetical protein
MKKSFIISLFIVLALVIMLLSAYITRNQWASYLIKQTVYNKSKGKVSLNFSQLDLDIFHEHLTITKPVLNYTDIFINPRDSVRLLQSSFNKMSISQVSFWDFIRYRQIVCEKLLLEKPDFEIKSADSLQLKNPSSFDPGSVLSILEKQRISHVGIQFLIKTTQIEFGKVELVQKQSRHEYGSTEYKISIKNLGTPLNKEIPDSLNIVGYDQLVVKIIKLHRHSAKSNLDIKIDSAFYNSQHKHFIVQGFHFATLEKASLKQPKIAININWADFIGLHLNDLNPQAKEIHFRKLKLIGGTVALRRTASSNNRKSENWFKALKNYSGITLDTLVGKHIHFLGLDKNEDTLLMLNRLNFDLGKVALTKNFFGQPLKGFRYDSININLQSLRYFNKSGNWKLKSQKIQYLQNRQTLSMAKILANRQNDSDSLVAAQRMVLKNFSVKKLQKQQPQQLLLALEQAYINVNLDSLNPSSAANRLPDYLKPLTLSQLRLKDCRLRLKAKSNKIALGRFNFYVDGLHSNLLLAAKPDLIYDTLYFEARNNTFVSDSTHQFAASKSIKFQNNKLTLRRFTYKQDSVRLEKSLSIPAVSLTHFNLSALLFHHKAQAGGAYFYKPHLRLSRTDSIAIADTNRSNQSAIGQLPFKMSCFYVSINQGKLNYSDKTGSDSLLFQSDIDLKWHRFRWAFKENTLLERPKKWDIKLYHMQFTKGQFYGSLAELASKSEIPDLQMKDFQLNKYHVTSKSFQIKLPSILFTKIDLASMLASDTLAFDKLAFKEAQITLPLPQFSKLNHQTTWPKMVFLYDSLQLVDARFTITKNNDSAVTQIDGHQLHLLYHPYLRHPYIGKINPDNLLSKWTFQIQKVTLTDTLKNFKMVADRIELQSKSNQLSVHQLVGSNFARGISTAAYSKLYQHFHFENIQLKGLTLKRNKNYHLNIKNVYIPHLWYNFLDEKSEATTRSSFPASINLPANLNFLSSIHIDSTHFADVNLSYQYEHRTKIIQADKLGIFTKNINLTQAELTAANHPYLFATMLINLNGKRILSGDSLYSFQTKDIRIDLPNKQISLDSLSIIPQLGRKDFFKKSIYQTDRITVYGKSIAFNNFDLNQIIQKQRFDLGSLQFDHFNMLFERDKSYPLADVIKPLPIESLQRIPIQFFIDSVQLRNSQLSYYEYNEKSRQPGIFFVDNFNLHVLNVTNDFTHIDSTLVLKFRGGGTMMKQSKLNFAMVMPYFAPNHQFWFSGHTGPVDLSQFNSLTQNTMGIGVVSGKGSAEIPYVTGNDEFVKGSMYFLYRNLKLRLYNRKKAQMNKGIGSPFVNFMLNNLMIRSNNSSFLKHPRKGIIYYERDPRKSFINYIWKSSLSGMLSTMGFNNKQQRQGKREEKKASRQKSK